MRFALFFFGLALSATVQAGIYEDLWALDQKENGLSPEELITDEGEPYQKGKDAAEKPLFEALKSNKTSGPTYTTVKALFDNYEYDGKKPEDEIGANPPEDTEREAFLTEVLKTGVMKATAKHLELSDGDMREELRREWFEPFTNYYAGKADPYCTGFEHVFIGEEGSSKGFGGYHFWYKYYLEELAGLVNYLGFNYGGVDGGENEPYVATLAMTWKVGKKDQLKPISGFMVGASPELILAWGTLAYFDNAKASATKTVDVPVTIDKTEINLVMHRETLKGRPTKMGKRIRTFYPVFKGLKED